MRSRPRRRSPSRDAYDDCVADLDEQIGRLVDELERRGVLERTWVIVTADHGESFGEHPNEFWHGTSLYQPQRQVPLVIVPPRGGPSPRVVARASEPARPAGHDRGRAGLAGGLPISRRAAEPVLDRVVVGG